jgi:hypothetical protein
VGHLAITVVSPPNLEAVPTPEELFILLVVALALILIGALGAYLVAVISDGLAARLTRWRSRASAIDGAS